MLLIKYLQPKSRKRKVFDPSAEYKKGGALLTKNVTCKKCGWEWDAADGGDDITTCHKCGSQGLVHAQDGGESGCPEGYAFNPITGECIEWNPTVWNSEEEPTSYDPVGDIVYMNPNDRPEGMSDEEYAQMYQDQIEHEQLHRLQWINGELKGESKTPLRMPSTVDNQQYDGEHYYNRRGEEEKYLHDIWNQRNPELAKFLPEDMVYNKEVNPLMYNIPWTEEGEARGYEGAVHNGMESIFPKRKEGGAMSPKDLDPEQMKRYLADLRIQENGIKKGFKNGKWYPHGSVEGGADTIAYGHKLTPNESYLRKGITEDAALQLQQGDVLKNQALAKKQVDKKYGAGTFDKLPQDSQMLLVDYQYNLGSLSGFPSFVDATVKGDKDKMLAQHTRYGAGKPLTKRNNWTVDVINNMGIPKPYDPMQVTIPQANVPDATNVVQPIIFPGPDESIELELTPEEIKEYQMGGYTVEDVEDINNIAQDGGSVYTYAGRPGSYYQKRGSKWYISNSGTNGEYVPLQDADGKRTALLNKSAVKVMSNPTTSKEEKYKNLPAYSNSPMVASVKGKTEAERKQVDDAIYTQNLIAKMRADTAESQKNALPQHEQPLVAQDWIWTLPMMGGSAMKSAGTAIADGMGAVGTKVMPYVTGALETSLPFMKSIPGATVGNALGAGFAADAVVNRLPKVPGQIARGEYMDAAENVITGGLDVLGAGVVSPLYEGARGAMSGLKKFIGTEEGLLSRINDVPVELPGSVNNSANVNKGVLESIVEGVSRTKERDALNSLELQSLNETQLGQGNAMDLFDDFKREKLADLETPEGNRRIQKYIDDNQLGQTVWDNGNYEEEFNRIEKTVDASSPEVLTFIEGIKERAKVANVSPQDMGYSKIKSWDELTPEFVTNDLKARLHLVDEIVRKSPDFTGTDKLIPITTDDYIKQFKKMSYEDVQDKFQQRMIQVKTTNDKLDLLKTEERKLRKAFDEGKISIREFGPGLTSVKKNIQVSQDNLRAFQRQATALKDKLNLDNASFSYGNQVFIGNPYTTVGDLKQTMQHEAAGHGLISPFLEIDKDAMVVKNSALDKELINGLDLKKRTPKHLLRKINVKEVSEAAPYNVTRLGIERAKNPKYYFRAAKNYFQKGNTGISGMSQEPVAFAAEVRNSLRERNVIGSDYDNITPEMLEQHYNEYIESPLYERNLRLFDIMDPTKKSFKVLSGVLNNMKAVAPYAVPVGIGVGAASGSEELQEEMQYQDGGIIMELSDDEIQQYANGGFIVEELDYKPNAGKTLNKKETPAPNVATIPKININTEGLSYKPSASAKPQNKNPKPVVKPKPQETVKVEKVKPEVTTDSMTTILDKYAIGDTSPIMTTNVFQDIFAKQDMEKQAKIEKLRRQIEASQNQIKKQGTSTYKYQEELIEGMPNIRTTESESYLQGSPLKNEVKKVVLHHTGTIDEKNNNKYVHNHFMNPKSETSSHIVIEEDGLRTIYASPDQVTFHAGKSSWDGRSNVNDFGIGVEFQGDTNLKPLTDAQIESFVEYFDQLAKQYKISTKDIITHAMVAPGRKPDITEREYKKILKYLKDKGYK